MSLDFTYNLIRDVGPENEHFKVGFIVGMSCSKRITPFALVISTRETREVYYQIFKSFMEIMKKAPKAIISDEAHAIEGAIEELNLEV